MTQNDEKWDWGWTRDDVRMFIVFFNSARSFPYNRYIEKIKFSKKKSISWFGALKNDFVRNIYWRPKPAMGNLRPAGRMRPFELFSVAPSRVSEIGLLHRKNDLICIKTLYYGPRHDILA